MSPKPKVSLCLSAAMLFVAGCAGRASKADAPVVTRVKCKGINECASQGQCAMKNPDGSDANLCGGQNSCKGKGWMEVDQDACMAQGGEVLEVVKSYTETCMAEEPIQRADAAAADKYYNIGRDKLAIDGYDPVAYFEEGGGKPMKGKPEFSYEHEGVIYHFANAENMALFKEDPLKYEPAYGGWCAYGMAKNGKKIQINPEMFLIEDGRLMLFYKTAVGDTRAKWLEEPGKLKPRADSEWSEKTRECPEKFQTAAPAPAPQPAAEEAEEGEDAAAEEGEGEAEEAAGEEEAAAE
jgi:YHS domain-containing protein